MAGKIPRQLVKNILGKRKNLMEQMIKVLANRKKTGAHASRHALPKNSSSRLTKTLLL